MTTLTQVAITARKSIRYTIYFIVFLTIGRILFGVAFNIYRTIFPPPPPAPTVKFGKLTVIPFPTDSPKVNLNFSLETATGGFPSDLPAQAKVYFMPKVNPNLLALDNAKFKANAMGFKDLNPIQLSETLYRFANPQYPTVMEMNIVTGAFSISYDLNADRSPVTNRPSAAEIAAEKFRNILTDANVLPADITGPMTPGYFKLESGQLVKVLALSEADLTKVNLFRKDYDKLPSLTSKSDQANIWAIVSGASQKDQQIIASEYHYFPVDETQFSTYPLIKPEEAYDQLTKGNAFIANMGQYKDGDSLKIRKIYLAYFDPGVPSDFYQPVYVFDSGETESRNSFVGYIPAVNPTYYSDN